MRCTSSRQRFSTVDRGMHEFVNLSKHFFSLGAGLVMIKLGNKITYKKVFLKIQKVQNIRTLCQQWLTNIKTRLCSTDEPQDEGK